jgi:uncharacterized protein with NRDE domain
MCLVVLFFRVAEDAPVVVGANREEDYARPGEPPQLLDGPCRIAAGLDPRGGGTWLGVNEHGVLVAVANRRKSRLPPQPRSRGLLVRDLLGCRSAAEAVEQATRELDQNRYAGCNLLCADSDRAVVLQAGDWLRIRPLPPGLHVVANDDVNDGSVPRVGYAMWWLHQKTYTTAADCLEALKELCAVSGDGAPDVCIHGQDHGTVSSSLLALRHPLSESVYLHAQGPPDRAPYEDYSRLFRQLRG